MTTSDLTPYYSERLARSLREDSGMNDNQVTQLTKRFESFASTVGNDASFKMVMDTYGSRDPDQMIASIHSELEKYAASHPGIVTNSTERIRRHIAKFNANIAKLSVQVSDIDGESEKVINERIKDGVSHLQLKMPTCFATKSFCAYGGTKTQGQVRIELDVRY